MARYFRARNGNALLRLTKVISNDERMEREGSVVELLDEFNHATVRYTNQIVFAQEQDDRLGAV